MIVTPGAVTLADLERIYRDELSITLTPETRAAIDASAAMVAQAAAGADPVYGVNTGFGKLASRKIEPQDTATLQRNLILSHCCGVGAPLSVPLTRLMMTLKLMSLGRGASGVRHDVCALLEAMLEHGVTPVVPHQGSVGASGDLAPLAHMAAVMLGAGEAVVNDLRLPGAVALGQVGLSPLVLGPKEGLALINGTQFSTACALAGYFEAMRAVDTTIIVAAMSTDAIMGSTAPLMAEIHALRGHAGQIEVAAKMRDLMAGSDIRDSHWEGDTRVQDPYCIRCQPQVVGAALDVIRMAGHTLQVEANAVTDNPLVLPESGQIESGGNFHA